MEATVEEKPKESTENALPNNSSKEPEQTPTPSLEPKKNKKEDRSRKDDKNMEQFMKSLNSIPSVDEKLSLVCKKYVQATDENKKLQFYIKQSDKRYALVLKEKEQLQLEYNKTVLVKSKLENLCRELQKQNKAIKEESLLKIREEEERRKETQAKFQNTLSEITALLHQNNEKNAKLRDDNISMSEKFKSVVQQYQLREQQVDKMAKQMALESQLSDAKLQKASLEHQADKERLMSEMEQIKVTMAQYRAKIMELQGTETSLRGQLGIYTDKYDEFQNALVKSNQMFGGFKEQMDMMSKKIKKLEKESLSWKTRWEGSQTALLDMCSERQASEERAAHAARQLHHMQSLCRTLQAERTVLLNSLKEHNIERPPLPTPPPAPVAPPPAPTAPQAPASNAKVDAMAANCAQLRQSLAHLQSQLNVLTNKQQTKEESPKPEKAEKTKKKSTKNKAQKAENTPKDESDEPSIKGDQPNVTENQPTNGDDTVQIDSEKVDDKTLENLIQAINNANINLCDLEVVNNEVSGSKENSLKEASTAENVKLTEVNIGNETSTEVKVTESTSNGAIVRELPNDETNSNKVAESNVTIETTASNNKEVKVTNVIETKSNEVEQVLANLNEVKDVVTKLNELNNIDDVSMEEESQNVSIVSVNDEVSHIDEVKSIAKV